MDSVPSLCLMWLLVWHTKMYQHGTGISAGVLAKIIFFLNSFPQFSLYCVCFLVFLFIRSNWLMFFYLLGYVRTFPLSCVATRLMWRIGRWKQSRLPFTGRKISSTTKFLPRAITTLRNHFCILPESLQGNVGEIFFLYF